MKRKLFIGLVVLGVTLLTIFQVKYLNSSSEASKQVDIETYTIPPAEKVFINGVIEPVDTNELFLDSVKGDLNETFVQNGQEVKKGDTLFEYKNTPVIEQIEQIDIQLDSHHKQIAQLTEKKNKTQNKLAEERKSVDQKKSEKQKEQEQLKLEEQRKLEELKKLEEQKKLEEEGSKQEEQSIAENESDEGLEEIQIVEEQLETETRDSINFEVSQIEGNILALENEIGSYDDQITSINNQISSIEKQKALLKEKAYTTVVAPISGIIIMNNSQANSQLPFITIVTAEYYVNGTVTEKDWAKIEIGQPAEILVHSINKTVTGKIKYIGDRPMAPDMANNTIATSSTLSNYKILIELNAQENLINGFHVQAIVESANEKLSIPEEALFSENGKSYVYKEEAGQYIKQLITYSTEEANKIILHSGLKEGDKVVRNPQMVTEDGNGNE
ncbi:HlyD family efflux transporter periplasmic adaptor subunit [Sutcliffiella horikoshii]|uniref:efflux RND transporter periplasmic adaptor subunit n=1 Tax=Sutcliffiella horikoshii TaxID=79883 RepID=UPI00384E3C9E